jgi:serine/threonine-protein kinase
MSSDRWPHDQTVKPGVGPVGTGDASLDVRLRLERALGATYRVGHEITGGGSSRVFAALELALDRPVVIKVLPPDLAAAVSIERFHREIHLAARLQHPHIVPLLNAGTADEMLYYTMPFVEGESLRQRIEREGALPIHDTVRVLLEVADALAYANAHGVVHRDIKPGNVLLSAGHALVTDFGVAKALSSATTAPTLTSAGVALGTPTYMAPEQGTGGDVADHRADIYSLGVIGYEMLTGRPPFTGTSVTHILVAHATQAPVPVTDRRADVPESLATLVMRCLEKQPDDRPQTAAEIRDEIDAMRTSRSVSAPHGIALPVARRRRVKRALVAGSFLGMSVAAIAGYRVYRDRTALDPNRVIVASFENKTGKSELDQFGEMAADWITRGLTETGLADAVSETVSSSDVAGKVKLQVDPRALSKQARALGAARIVLGALYAVGDSLQFHARVLDGTDGKTLVSIPPTSGAISDPMAAINTVRTRVLGALASMEPSEVVGIVSSDAPPSYEAYREFLRGEEAFSIGHFTETIEHDRRALSLDSTYLAPLVRMAYAFNNLAQCAQTDSVGRIANARRDRLPAYEGYYLDRVLAWCLGDWNAAYVAAQRILAVAPHSSNAKYVAARSAIRINHPREAVEALERLDWKMPHISGYYSDLSQALHKLGKYERELEVTKLYSERLTGSLLPAEEHVRALSALGDVEEVQRVVAASRAKSSIEPGSNPTSVALIASSELTAHGHENAGRQRKGIGEMASSTAP